MPRQKKEEKKDEQAITDVTHLYFKEDGVPMVKKSYWSGKKLVKEEVVRD